MFELNALFCSPFGPNLRNEFAHGLIDNGGFFSVSVVYAWWFMLKWVAMPYLRALDQTQSDAVDQRVIQEMRSALWALEGPTAWAR